MQIPCSEIANSIELILKERVVSLQRPGVQPKLVDILIGQSSEQVSFVSIKNRVAKKLGIDFEFLHLPTIPSSNEFTNILQTYANNPKNTAIIVQHPLPNSIPADLIYKTIPAYKEIEGHTNRALFLPPLGLAVLTGLTFVLGIHDTTHPLITRETDKQVLISKLQGKRIVIAGNGPTGGLPIAQTLTEFGLSYITVTSKTINPQPIYKDADIIITAVGKKVIEPAYINPGITLLNVGLHEENGKLKGDYEEHEIEPIASYYTPTPGGLGPIDVLYLYNNLLDAFQLQRETKNI